MLGTEFNCSARNAGKHTSSSVVQQVLLLKLTNRQRLITMLGTLLIN